MQGIEARKTLTRMMPRIVASGFTDSMPTATAETYWRALQRWIVDTLLAEDGDTRHRVPRMIEGMWVDPNQPNQSIRRPQQFTSALLPRTSSDPVHDDEMQCLDLVQVPTVHPQGDWAWGVLSTAATSTYSHAIGLNNGAPWKFATWAWSEPRVYSVAYGEPLPYDHVARLYGDIAADRARHDRPAVQLRIKRIADNSG